MTDWRFDEARAADRRDAAAWLGARDELLREMEAAGLSAPDRLQQAYRSFGGGAEAYDELEAQRAVVDAYAATADDVNGARSFLERLGLVGGPDPAEQLAARQRPVRRWRPARRGGGRSREAQRILAAAESGGIVRLVERDPRRARSSRPLAVVLFRRRASYTAAP